MPRIRTIQPHFPRSASMCRLSRDARLLFILLWTVADDAGRARAAPDGLVMLLYASDPDASICLPLWLDELEREGCIERYAIGEVSYLRVVNWRKHQKIDRPTPSRLPAAPSERKKARESSRAARADSEESLMASESSADGREESDFSAREVTKARVIGDLDRVQRLTEARGVFTSSLRSIEMMGRHLGLWRRGEADRSKSTDRGGDASSNSPPLADVVPRTAMRSSFGARAQHPNARTPGEDG